MVESGLSVREMRLDEVHVRIDYFHDAPDDYLAVLGVDRALLPSRHDWAEAFRADLERPLAERSGLGLVWLLDESIVGFSTADRIVFGERAHMHLHIIDTERRRRGQGAQFVRLSAAEYFRTLELRQLFCEPHAFNVAPNRTLQRAGFRYLLSHECTPGPINFPQVTTRWVMDRAALVGRS